MTAFAKLISRIDMPKEAAEKILYAKPTVPNGEQFNYCLRLCDPAGYDGAYTELKERLTEDKDGFQMLRIMLCAALVTEGLYQTKGISEEIFIATMKCFTRFVCEHKESYGTYGFDRGFWTGRQLSLTLFRLGELEFETNGGVHIPSDADLSDDKVDASFSAARAFFPEGLEFACDSWMLSPALEKLLKPDSRILKFQRRFEIEHWNQDDEGYKLWVFKNPTLEPKDFPENTSLQRAMKAYVLGGGKIGEAFGKLKS